VTCPFAQQPKFPDNVNKQENNQGMCVPIVSNTVLNNIEPHELAFCIRVK